VKYQRSLQVLFLLLFAPACASTLSHNKPQEQTGLTGQSTFSSRVETIPESGGDFLTSHIVNSRFIFAPYAYTVTDNPVHLVLRETLDIEQSIGREMDDGTLTVEAFPAIGAVAGAPLWKISTKAVVGEISNFGLYKATEAACCDTAERSNYYSLINGKEILSSTVPLVSAEYAGTREKRYIGFDDGWGNSQPIEIGNDKTILGILYYANSSALDWKIALVGNRDRDCRASQISISQNGKPADSREVVLFGYEKQSRFDGFEISIELYCREDDVVEKITVPISSDRPDLGSAKSSPKVQLKALN
jgi:hypothetical protein